MPKPVILWSHPRSVSTAFERAFIQREDLRCFHEPFGEPFYYGPDRMSTRYDAEQCKAGQAESTYNAIYREILTAAEAPADERRFVFVKDMSQYIVKPSSVDARGAAKTGAENPTVFTDDELRTMTHSFLIRTPEKSVPSYYRCCIGDQAKETGFDTYDPNEAGYVESVRLYNYLVSIGIDPIIVDSADLVAAPVRVMRAYCAHVGIPYQEGMVEWKAERVESFDKWKGFHDDAQQSTGFKEVERDTKQEAGWPPIVKETIERNRQPYQYLHDRRVKVDHN